MDTPTMKSSKEPLKNEQGEKMTPLEADRQVRLQAIDLIFGIWKGRTDIPVDGLKYQQQVRIEW